MPAREVEARSAARTKALVHPLAVGAVLVLLANDHLLKHAAPGLVTGKLSDVSGLVFFPLTLAVALGWLARRAGRGTEPERGRSRPRGDVGLEVEQPGPHPAHPLAPDAACSASGDFADVLGGVHALTNLHWRIGSLADAGDDLDRPFLAVYIDDPESGERLSRRSERALRHDRHAPVDENCPRLG